MVCADFKGSVEPKLGQVIVPVLSAINCSIFSTDNVKKCGFSLPVAKALYEVLLPHTHASSTYAFVFKFFVLFPGFEPLTFIGLQTSFLYGL